MHKCKLIVKCFVSRLTAKQCSEKQPVVMVVRNVARRALWVHFLIYGARGGFVDRCRHPNSVGSRECIPTKGHLVFEAGYGSSAGAVLGFVNYLSQSSRLCLAKYLFHAHLHCTRLRFDRLPSRTPT